MSAIFYVYDTRTQLEKPLVVIYEEGLLEPVLQGLLGPHDQRPPHILVTTYRLHKYISGDSYVGGAHKVKAAGRKW